MARILITGGAGFIGSHTCVALINAGHDLVVIDSFSNSSFVALQRVVEITELSQKEALHRLEIVRGDVRDETALERVFTGAKAKGRKMV